MKKEKGPRGKDGLNSTVLEQPKLGPGDLRRAIAAGFGEYRRLISGIRSRTGRRNRRSLHALSN